MYRSAWKCKDCVRINMSTHTVPTFPDGVLLNKLHTDKSQRTTCLDTWYTRHHMRYKYMNSFRYAPWSCMG